MTELKDALKLVFPATPSPAEPKVLEISSALEAAKMTHIVTSYIPAGFGETFLTGIQAPTPFMVSLSNHLSLVLTPIITSALSAESTPGSNHILAWVSIQPSFDSLLLSAPAFMQGIDGLKFWQAVLISIRTSISPSVPFIEEAPREDGNEIVLRDEIL